MDCNLWLHWELLVTIIFMIEDTASSNFKSYFAPFHNSRYTHYFYNVLKASYTMKSWYLRAFLYLLLSFSRVAQDR
jgi:hypothetical protein